MTNTRLNPIALGLSLGVLWGISLLIIGLVAHYYSYGKPFISSLGTLYVGYTPTIGGSFIGGLIGFVDGFISGCLIAGLYNLFAKCGCRNVSCHTDSSNDTRFKS